MAVLCIGFCQSLQAQEKGTSEIKASVGFATSTDLVNLVSKPVIVLASGGTISYENGTYSPAFGLTYSYAVKNNWTIIGDVFYQTQKEDLLVNKKPDGSIKSNFYTVGIGSNYRYLNKGLVQLYAGLAVAYTFQNDKYTSSSANIEDSKSNFFNFQATALGIRVGKELAASAELGFGYKGIANIGVSYSF